ncbi:MAG: AzlD domain-containing protein [Actinomycetota bacterium]
MTTVVLTFALAGLLTYFLRVTMVLAGERPGLTDLVSTRATLIPPAVLAAIVAGALLVQAGRPVPPALIELLAVAAAVAAVRRTGNVGAAILVGLPVYWIGVAVGLG